MKQGERIMQKACVGGLLKSHIDENENASEELCRTMIEGYERDLMNVLTLGANSPDFDMSTVEGEIERVQEDYNQKAIGPRKHAYVLVTS